MFSLSSPQRRPDTHSTKPGAGESPRLSVQKADGLVSETIRCPRRLAAIEADWRALFAACAKTATVFQSFDWARATAPAIGAGRSLYVLTAWADGRLVALAPLQAEHHLGLLRLRWLGGEWAIYGDVLATPEVDVDTWLNQALGEASRITSVHGLRLDNVRSDATVHDFLTQRAEPIRLDHAPSIDLIAARSFGAWQQSQSRNARRSRSRRLRNLEARGTVTFEFIPAAATPLTRIARLLEMKHDWAAARSVVSRTIGDGRFETLVKVLADARQIDGRISTLLVDGEAIAMELGFVTGGRYLSYLGAYDPGFGEYSPGALQLERTLEACFAEGLEVFDLLPPNDPYKQSFASEAVPVASYHVALTVPGALQHQIARIDPVGLAKSAARHIPVRYRRALQPLAMRVMQAANRRSTEVTPSGIWRQRLRPLVVQALQLLALALAAWAVVAE